MTGDAGGTTKPNPCWVAEALYGVRRSTNDAAAGVADGGLRSEAPLVVSRGAVYEVWTDDGETDSIADACHDDRCFRCSIF